MSPGIFILDFEYASHRRQIHCMVAYEIDSKGNAIRKIRIGRKKLKREGCPFPEGSTLIGYSISGAECWAFRCLGWDPCDFNWVDVMAEWRLERNVENAPYQKSRSRDELFGTDEDISPFFSLTSCLVDYGLDHLVPKDKKEWQDLAIRGGKFTREEATGLVKYCEQDVAALTELWVAISGGEATIDMFIRGRYLAALSLCTFLGVPIHRGLLDSFESNVDGWKMTLIRNVDPDLEIWDEKGTRKRSSFATWIEKDPEMAKAWGLTGGGDYTSSYKVLDAANMKERFPKAAPVIQLLNTISRLKNMKLEMTGDRNTPYLGPLSTKTGRNAPSGNRFIYGLPSYMRCLISPPEGTVYFSLDWSQQEYQIAAQLSGDVNMISAYESGDVYIAAAKQFGLVPQDATKDSHPKQRALCKTLTLALMYGKGAKTLSKDLKCSTAEARAWIAMHRDAYETYYEWAEQRVETATVDGELSVPDWRLTISPQYEWKPTSVANFTTQATGAVMMRRAMMFAVEAGVQVVCPIHDAISVCCPEEDYEDQLRKLKSAMTRASMSLIGEDVRVDVTGPVHYGEYYGEGGNDPLRDQMINNYQSGITK